jgi:hypothetical protein
VVQAIRRYVLGPEAPGQPPVKMKVVSPEDTAPRVIELDPDSAAAQAAAESLRAREGRP